VFDIFLDMECCKGVEVIHREVLRWIIVAPTADPLETSCSSESRQDELFAMVIVAPG
jgi:hypothetical protein